jgi:hypothetical protein
MFLIATSFLGFYYCSCVVGSNFCGVSSPTNDGLFAGRQPELIVLIVMSLLGLYCGCAVGFNSCVVSSPTYDRDGGKFLRVGSQSW